MSKSPTPVEQESLFDAIARLLPQEQRQRFYRRMAHFHELRLDDEMLQIAEAMGFLALIIREAPAQMMAERERLQRLLASILTPLRAAKEANTKYHTQLESRLAKLPEAIANGIDPKTIASRIGESLRQHLMEGQIKETVGRLAAVAARMQAATASLEGACIKISDQKHGVLPQVERAMVSMKDSLGDATQHVSDLSGKLERQARPWLPWGVVAASFLVILLLLFHWPSEASRDSSGLDPAVGGQLPPNAARLVATRKQKERQVEELQSKVQDTEELRRELEGTAARLSQAEGELEITKQRLDYCTGSHPKWR